jgi:transposase-like protein
MRSRTANGGEFPTVVAAWRRTWDQVIPFFTFPPEIRRVIYTTNAIDSVNRLSSDFATSFRNMASNQPPNGRQKVLGTTNARFG